MVAMLISGALCGLAGWNEVYGVQYRLLEGLSSWLRGYRNDHRIAWWPESIGYCVSFLLFSALLVGGATMQRMTEVPYSVVDIIQGLVIVFVIARTAIHFGWPQKLLRKGKKDA